MDIIDIHTIPAEIVAVPFINSLSAIVLRPWPSSGLNPYVSNLNDVRCNIPMGDVHLVSL